MSFFKSFFIHLFFFVLASNSLGFSWLIQQQAPYVSRNSKAKSLRSKAVGETRWLSSYDCLVRLNELHLRGAWELREDRQIVLGKVEKALANTMNGLYWGPQGLVNAVIALMQPFKLATVELQTERFSTMGSVLKRINSLWNHITTTILNLREMISALQATDNGEGDIEAHLCSYSRAKKLSFNPQI